MSNQCPECGYPLQGDELFCPECGNRLSSQPQESATPHPQYQQSVAPRPLSQPGPAPRPRSMCDNSSVTVTVEKTDWANYIYECGVIMWNVFRHRYANVSGRASRREFWSFIIVSTIVSSQFVYWLPLLSLAIHIAFLIPYVCLWIRRMHDINRSGWWMLLPLVNFFMILKKSDERENDYGMPNPAKNMIY